MKAELIDHMGSDLTVVNAARVSFDKESTWEYPMDTMWANGERFDYPGEPELSAKDEKLIGYLGRHNHITTFTHCIIQLRETVPIFVARQRFKHTVGFTYNEVSRRYVDTPPGFYVPKEWRKRPEGSVKQGSSDEAVETNEALKYEYASLIRQASKLYAMMVNGDGVCPEQARMVLPQSMMTSYYVTGSLAAFARAYKLRADSHAQVEIQVLAKQWDEIIRPLYPHAWKALVNG